LRTLGTRSTAVFAAMPSPAARRSVSPVPMASAIGPTAAKAMGWSTSDAIQS
jgi:hypothetical protein